MNNTLTLLGIMALMVAGARAMVPGVRPVSGSAHDRALSIIKESGESYLAGREMRVDLDFPSGKTGKGVLFIAFDGASRHFFHILWWEREDYPKASVVDEFVTSRQFGLDAGQLVIFCFQNPFIGIHETTETATSLDEAEAKSLKWSSEHMREVEARTNQYRYFAIDLRHALPRDFLPDRGGPDASPGLPIKFLGIELHNGNWEFTLESEYKGKLLVESKSWWIRGRLIRIDEAQHKKQ